MNSFYQKHQKLISVLLVAVFVVGGVGISSSVFALPDNYIGSYPWDPNAGFLENTNAQYQGTVNNLAVFLANIEALPSTIQADAQLQRFKYIAQKVIDDTSGKYTAEQKKAMQKYLDQINSRPGLFSQTAATIKPAVVDAQNTDQPPGKLQEILGSMLAWFLYYIAIGLGWIMMLICKVMLIIGVFNSFLKQPAVQAGWTITRDICNNFFIIFMMILAVGVTLHLPSYAWRNLLPKILIYAVLINFSLLFTGVLIDVSQVLMLTFASPLARTQGYNIIISAFGLPDAYSMTAVIKQWANTDTDLLDQTGSISFYDIIAALLFAIIVTIVAIVVVTCITIILVYRIIMLMFLAVLSPLYFLGKAAPNISQLGQISGDWVSKLGKMLTVGPAMMFFLYLSFMTMAAVNNLNGNGSKASLLPDPAVEQGIESNEALNDTGETSVIPKQTSETNIAQSGALTAQEDYTALSGMASVNGVINFLIVVGLLWVSLMMGQKFGDGAGKVASQGMGWLSGAAKKYSGFNLGKKGVTELKKVPGAVVSGAVAKVGTGALGAASATTRGFGRVTGSVGLQKLGEVGGQWRKDVLGARRKARIAKLSKAMGKMGLGSDEVKQKWGEFTDTDLAKRTKAAALGLGSVGATVGTAILTGGAGLAPGLAIAAAGYLGGGGRLAELGLGQWGIRRAKSREEKQKKIDEAKKATAQIVADSEAGRDKDIESDANIYFSNPVHRAARDTFKSSKKRMSDIENTELTDKNRKNGKGLDPELEQVLKDNGWNTGTEITDDMLRDAKKDIKMDTKGRGVWKGLEKNVNDFQMHQDILDNSKNIRENEHRKNVKDKLDDKYNKAKTPEEKKILDVERKRFETEYDAKITSNLRTEKIEADLAAKLDLINESNVPESKKIEDRRQAQKEYDEEKSRINKSYTDTIAPVQHQIPKPTAADKFLEDYKPYAHENWVSQGVSKDAQKMAQTAKDIVAAMEAAGSDVLAGFHQVSRGSFYSNSGQTETQFKSMKAMMDSTKATQSLIDALSALPKNLSGEQAQMVKELKQGIAAFKKGGGDTTKLAAVIALLDQKTGTNKNGKVIDDKTVSEYEADVKPKK